MASIYQRGKGQWEAKIRKKGFPSECKTFDTKKQAELWAAKVEREMESGSFRSTSQAENTTIESIIERYRNTVTRDPRRTPRAQKNEEYLLDSLVKEFGEYSMHTLKAKHVSAFKERMVKAGKRASTVNHYINKLSAIYTHATKEWSIEAGSNPCHNVSKVKPDQGRNRRLSPEEEGLILAAADDARNDSIRQVIEFAIETAMRQDEIAQIEWKYVYLDKRYVHLPKTKNGDPRDVPLSSRAIAILDAQKGKSRPFPMSASAIKQSFRRIVERAGVEDLHFHDLRHEATSRLAELYEVHELAKVTGHKSLSMLMRYYHPTAESLAKKLS